MSVTVHLQCSGCDDATEYRLERRRVPIATGLVIGGVVYDNVEDAAPDGWWVWDPYTLVTYCPRCRAGIEAA